MSMAPLPPLAAAERPTPSGRIGPNLLAAEWTKIRSVRSTYWTLLAAVGATIGLSAVICAVFVAQWDGLSPSDKVGFDPASLSLTGGVLAQIAIAVLGVLVITSEYGSGMIRTTFAAAPQRLSVLAAKATVFAALTLVVTTATCLIAFFIGQAILSAEGIGVGIGAPGALRAVVGTGLYLSVLGLLALGTGTLIRQTAGAITAMFGVIFVLPIIAALLPSSMEAVSRYLPTNAGEAIITGGGVDGANSLSPWVGFGVFCLYAVVALGAAAVALVRRDA